jgi:alcohol dehydrogenase
MLAAADATMLLPDGLAFEQAAPIFCAGYTVWSGLRWAEPQPGETVAVLGVGGLGHLAVQYAKAAGFRTIAVSRSPDKAKLLADLGADTVVRDGAGLAKEGGADVLLGTGNSMAALAEGVAGLRPDGRLVVMGFEAAPLPLSPADLIMKRIRVLGSQQNHRAHLFEALRFVAEGKVRVVTETFPLADAPKAYDRVEQGKVRFRAVLVP